MEYTLVIVAASEDAARDLLLTLRPEGSKMVSLEPWYTDRWIAVIKIDFDVTADQRWYEGGLNAIMRAPGLVWWTKPWPATTQEVN